MNSQMNMYIGWELEETQTQELLSPWSWVAPPPAHRCGHQPGCSLNPVLVGIVWRLQPTDTTDHDLNLLHFFPSWRMGCGAKSFKCLILSGDQTLTWSHPELPYQDKRHSSHPGKSKGFSSSVSAARVKDQTLEQRMLLELLSLRKAQRF